MKKLLVLILVTLIMGVLAGCNQTASESKPTPSPTATVTPTTSPNGNVAPIATPEVGNDEHRLDPMTFQLSQDQVKAMFGNKYMEMNDPVGGEAKVWRYDIQPSKDYKSEGQFVDVNSIEDGNLKGQVFVTWSVERKLISIVSYYLLNGKVTESWINEYTLKKAYSLPTATLSSSSDFKLSDREQEVYNNFQKDLNEQRLNGLEPISIAKLYVQAILDNKNDVVYALYTDKKGHVQWTKEEDEKIPNSDRGTREQTFKTFNNIEKGKFVQTSDFEGYIEYQSRADAESKSGFHMIKDDDGIWNVSFQPIQ